MRNASPCAALSAPASPSFLQELAEVATNPATTPTQAALITAIVAKTAQQWDRVGAICTPITVPRPGSRCIDRAQAWFLLGKSADARQQWPRARHARRQVRALTPTTHPLWISASILDLEQAIRRQHLADAAAICRWLMRAERIAQPLSPLLQGRCDLAMLESSLLGRCTLNAAEAARLKRTDAWLQGIPLRDAVHAQHDLLRLIRILLRIGAVGRAQQHLRRLDAAYHPQDAARVIAIETHVLSGTLALARGGVDSAIHHRTAAHLGLTQIAATDPEQARLATALADLDAAIDQHRRTVVRA